MKISFSHALKSYDGKEMKRAGQPEEKVVDGEKQLVPTFMTATLMWAACEGLVAGHPDLMNEPADVKIKKFALASKIAGAKGAIEITPEELTLVRAAINKMFGPAVVGAAFALLDA